MTSTSIGTVRAAAAAAGRAGQDAGAGSAELVITGMTCSACAVRIERRLNKLDGVAATVSFATGRAYLTSLGGREVTELIAVVGSVMMFLLVHVLPWSVDLISQRAFSEPAGGGGACVVTSA